MLWLNNIQMRTRNVDSSTKTEVPVLLQPVSSILFVWVIDTEATTSAAI